MTALAARLPKYLAIGRASAKNATTYLSNLVTSGGLVFIRVWVFTQLYTVTFAATGSSQINGFTLPMVIWSLMIAQALHRSASVMQDSKAIDDEVKTGTLAYTINRPYSYILYHISNFFGRSFASIGINVGLGVIAALILVGPVAFSVSGMFAAIPLLVGGFTITILIGLIVGLSAFWFEDISAFNWMYQKASMVFGGMIIPIALFPDSIRGIVEVSPFAQQYFAPAQMLLQYSSSTFVKFLIAQVIWILLLVPIVVGMFKLGERRVVQNGG